MHDMAGHCLAMQELGMCVHAMQTCDCYLLLRRAGFDFTIEAAWTFSNNGHDSNAQGSLK